MKNIKQKIIGILALVFSMSFITNAQDSKAYLGLSAGFALPLGDLGDVVEPGFELGLINIGFRFNETFGVALNWGASAHNVTDTDGELALGVGYFALGPMISIARLDIKPQYAAISGVITDGSEEITEDGSGFILGTSYNFSISDYFGISANADFLSLKFENADESDNIIKLSAGIRYLF